MSVPKEPPKAGEAEQKPRIDSRAADERAFGFLGFSSKAAYPRAFARDVIVRTDFIG